jgi:hypothetical protein
MKVIESIAKEEQEFPRMFASFEERDYGTLFFNTKIKDHHDSNHAVIYPEKVTDLSAVLNDITNFYQKKGITPALYHPPVEDYFINNAKVLKACGYEFTIELDRRIMVLTEENINPVSNRLTIKRITESDIDKHFVPDDDEYLKETLNNSINNKDYYIFLGYYKNIPVSLLSFHCSQYGCTRFDEMATAKGYRNNGFARDMNNFAANYCRENGLPIPYQWPAHDTSERITTEAGFRVSFTLPAGYADYVYTSHYTE